MHLESRFVSIWTFLGALLLLGFVAYMIGGYELFFEQFPSLFGNYETLATDDNVLPTCIVATCISAVCSLLSLFCLSFWSKKKNPIRVLISQQRQNFDFFYFFVLTAIEEIVVRWLFVGILPEHIPYQGSFYLCLLGGTCFWWWFRDRYYANMRFTTFIQYLISSVIYAFIFVKYGLLASYMVHLGANSLLLGFHKVEDHTSGDKDFVLGVLSLLYACLSVFYLSILKSKNPWLITNWIYNNELQLEGWGFFDYFFASVMAIYLIKSATIFLSHDQSCVQANGQPHPMPMPYQVILGFIILACLVLLSSLVLFMVDVQLRALLLTMLVCSFYTPSSGSGRVRNFWITLVAVFMMLCVLSLVKWYQIPLYFLLHGIIYLPFIAWERQSVRPNS